MSNTTKIRYAVFKRDNLGFWGLIKTFPENREYVKYYKFLFFNWSNVVSDDTVYDDEISNRLNALNFAKDLSKRQDNDVKIVEQKFLPGTERSDSGFYNTKKIWENNKWLD